MHAQFKTVYFHKSATKVHKQQASDGKMQILTLSSLFKNQSA
jgi:hypothetical protein